MFQTDVFIAPGSSGGPLFNDKKEIVGVTTSGIEEGLDINYAIPINYVIGAIKSLDDKTKQYIGFDIKNALYRPPTNKTSQTVINASTNQEPNKIKKELNYKPKRDLNFGIESLGLPYNDSFSGGTIWVGKNHFRIKGGEISLATPSVYLRDGFENDNFDLTFANVEYFIKNNFNGLWFGVGYGSWKGTVGHEEEIELGTYENVRLGFTFGYQYKLMNNFYINGWGGIYALMTGDTEAPVGSKTVYFDEGIPLISIDIGWYY